MEYITESGECRSKVSEISETG